MQTQIARGTATNIYGDNNDTVVRYHQTEVVRFNAERIILKSGGWMTATTKLRMNQASNQFGLGFNVYQKAGDWHVVDQRTGKVTEFSDGMTIQRRA